MQGAGSVSVVTTSLNWPFPGTTSSQVIYGTSSTGGVPLPGSTKADYERGDRYLHKLAEKTAGRLYQANDTAQLAAAFASVAEELRRQYSLGYYPQRGDVKSDARRQIKVIVKRANLVVKARDSYMRSAAPSPGNER